MIQLRDLADCFEGMVPSIIATSASDGAPNVSYLSHVVVVDETHVAISNQFFAKTAANIRANPQACLLLVSGRDGGQFRLDVTWVSSRDEGALFERVSSHLRASSEQIGMAGIMRLKAVDIFRVDAIAAVASPVALVGSAPAFPAPDPSLVDELMARIGSQGDTEGVVTALLDGCESLGAEHVILTLCDSTRRVLTTLGSRGYEHSGVGSEVTFGDGLIGASAEIGQVVKVNDTSRTQRMGAAIKATTPADENRMRTIAVPGLPNALSQMAVPLLAKGALRGVLFIESRYRMAFEAAHEVAFEQIAAQCALAMEQCEEAAFQARAATGKSPTIRPDDRPIRVQHHRFDDSVFIDDEYVIKGVAGRLLVFMLDLFIQEGRTEFTNREIRLARALRLPESKDNLETRLLLLRRRLDEKGLSIRLVHAGRGRVSLCVSGVPKLSMAE